MKFAATLLLYQMFINLNGRLTTLSPIVHLLHIIPIVHY